MIYARTYVYVNVHNHTFMFIVVQITSKTRPIKLNCTNTIRAIFIYYIENNTAYNHLFAVNFDGTTSSNADLSNVTVRAIEDDNKSRYI